MTTETVKMITQSLTRMEEKLDKNTESLFELKAAHSVFAEKSRKFEEMIEEANKRHDECPARKSYKERTAKKKNIAFVIGVTATATTIITGIIATIYEFVK